MSDVWLARGAAGPSARLLDKRVLPRGCRHATATSCASRRAKGAPVGYGFFHSALAHHAAHPDLTTRTRSPDEAWLRERSAPRRRSDATCCAFRRSPTPGASCTPRATGCRASSSTATAASGASRSSASAGRAARGARAGAGGGGRRRAGRRTGRREGGRAGGHRRFRRRRVEPVEIEEDGVRYRVDPPGGHKTGFFLDQRDNRRLLACLARGRTVFDGMTYAGGFALAAARAGAASVRGMDLDEEAMRATRRSKRGT